MGPQLYQSYNKYNDIKLKLNLKVAPARSSSKTKFITDQGIENYFDFTAFKRGFSFNNFDPTFALGEEI